MWLRLRNTEGKKKHLSFPPLWEFQTPIFSLRVPDPFLLLGDPRPHESQQARPPCPSQTPIVYSNSCPSSRWCHSAIWSSVVPFSSCPVFSNESTLRMRWPKYWSSSFSISPFNEHPGLISFKMDWLDLLAVQGTLKSLLQHHSSKASIFRRSAVFIVQLSRPYMTTGKTVALTGWTFVGMLDG